MSDPFTLVHDAIWDMLEDHAALTALVKTANRVKFDKRTPIKAQVQAADLPELRVVHTGSNPHLERTSNMTTIERIWQVQLAVGDMMYSQLFPIEWEVIRALKSWRTRLQALEWPASSGKYFVVHTKLVEHVVGSSDFDLSRGVKGWTAVWSCETLMSFLTGDL